WTISAQDGWSWFNSASLNYFAFMAARLDVNASRIGNYELSLYNNGAQTFSFSQNNVLNQYAHLGTNSVTLGAGLFWDAMVLHYTMLSSENGGTPVNTVPTSQLPIFGAPDQFWASTISYQQEV